MTYAYWEQPAERTSGMKNKQTKKNDEGEEKAKLESTEVLKRYLDVSVRKYKRCIGLGGLEKVSRCLSQEI